MKLLDTNRIALVHFSVHALDVLGVWDDEELLDNCLRAGGGFAWLGGTFVGRATPKDWDNRNPCFAVKLLLLLRLLLQSTQTAIMTMTTTSRHP